MAVGSLESTLSVDGVGLDRWVRCKVLPNSLVVPLLRCGETCFGSLVGGGSLLAFELLDPVQGVVHFIVAGPPHERVGFGGSMGFLVILLHLVSGQGVGADHLLLAGQVGASVVPVKLDAVDIGVEIAEDRNLPREGVGRVGTFDLGFDALYGGQVFCVVGWSLSKRSAAYKTQERQNKNEAWIQMAGRGGSVVSFEQHGVTGLAGVVSDGQAFAADV